MLAINTLKGRIFPSGPRLNNSLKNSCVLTHLKIVQVVLVTDKSEQQDQNLMPGCSLTTKFIFYNHGICKRIINKLMTTIKFGKW